MKLYMSTRLSFASGIFVPCSEVACPLLEVNPFFTYKMAGTYIATMIEVEELNTF